MTKLLWSSKSLQDLADIWDYIAADSPPAAKYVIHRIRSRARLLRSHPQSGTEPSELQGMGLREVVCGNYRIIFRLEYRTIEIVTVHHASRSLGRDNLS